MNEVMPFTATWMELEIVILSETNQTEKDKYYILNNWNLKKGYRWIYLQKINRIMDVEDKFMVTRGNKHRDWDWHIYITIYKVDSQ